MEITRETIGILIVLVPGFLSALIYNRLIYREEGDHLNRIVEALIYSLLIYFTTILVTGQFAVNFTLITDGSAKDLLWTYNKWSISCILGLIFIFPLILGYVTRYDLLHRLFRKIGVTNRTGRDSIWLDVFHDIKKSVVVHMKDGRRLFGWPQYFSNKIGPGSLYLSHAAWIDANGKYIDLDINGIFLIDHENISHIEFLNSPS